MAGNKGRDGVGASKPSAGLTLLAAGVVVAATGVGVLSATRPAAAAAVVAAALLFSALVGLTRHGSARVDWGDKGFTWISFAWAYLMVRPIGHFTAGRSSLDAVAGVPSVERVIDLGSHGVIAALAIWSLRRNRFSWRPSWLILALPALALTSTAWSLAPIVTLGFVLQLLAMYLLATLTAAIYREDPDRASAVLRRALRFLVQGVVVLCFVGLAFPFQGDPANHVLARFTWPGQHPLVATADIGLAGLVTLFARKEIGLSRGMSAGVLVLFGYCLYLGQSRTAFIGLAVALLFGLWSASEGRSWVRRLAGVLALLGAALVIESMFGGPIAEYVYRGQSQEQVYNLNGRIGLWSFAIDQLHTAGQWLFGYGLGGTRVLLASSVAWAGDAHGAWIELLVSLGLVGVTVAVGVVATLAWRLFQSGRAGSLASRAIPVLFVYVLAMSPAATGFAIPGPEPGLGFALLAFCYGATAGPRRSLSSAVAPLPGQAERGVAPAPRHPPSPLRVPSGAGGTFVRP